MVILHSAELPLAQALLRAQSRCLRDERTPIQRHHSPCLLAGNRSLGVFLCRKEEGTKLSREPTRDSQTMVRNYPIHLVVQKVRQDPYYFHSSRRSISVTRQVMDASGRAPSGHSAHCRSARTGEQQHLSRPCFGHMLAIKLSAREHTWGYTPNG